MLQKEFFQVQPFNPNPYWNNTIVNLSGAQKFEENTVFKSGRYSVLVIAGGSSATDHSMSLNVFSGKIEKNIIVEKPFIVRAYCGSKTGINPYSGPFKVNPVVNQYVDVNHIFGTCGGSNKDNVGGNWLGSGNCLGDGWSRVEYGITYLNGAGSCVHIMPINGVFGTDYYYAFHTTSAVIGPGIGLNGGGGSALGGSASGGSTSTGSGGGQAQTSVRGGNTPYGNGGTGAYSGTGFMAFNSGNSGIGIGSGKACMINNNYTVFTSLGSTAFFNGSTWEEPGTTANYNEEGAIVIKFLGSL